MSVSVLNDFRSAVGVNGALIDAVGNGFSRSGPIAHGRSLQWTIGSGAGQVNKACYVASSTATGTPTLLDLTALTDTLTGAALTFASLAGYFFTSSSVTVGQNITLGGGTNALFSTNPELLVYPNGGKKFWEAPNNPLTIDGTHKIFQVVSAAGTPAWELTLWGK